MKMMFVLITYLSLSFLLSSHPLTLGTILIIQTILISLIMGMLSQTFWFSYMLFLIIIGGMLILFIYIISLIFNKKLTMPLNLMSYLILLILLISLLMVNKSFPMMNMEIMPDFNNMMEMSLNLMKLYNFPINLINLLMINYLFFLLIVVVKITNFFYGPLRMKI